jgi:hypothetical protein
MVCSPMVIGELMVKAACVGGANGGGDLRWPQPMVVAVFVHVGGGPPMSVSS